MALSADSKLIPVIATIFLPPLGVAIHEGITSRFWICLVLSFFFVLPGTIYALYVILK
jgi:uncharacterized membrane protein YqaE (UPF0057 family)